MAKNLKRLVYRSKSLILNDDFESLGKIFEVSVKNNRRNSITGCLAQPDGHFVQVIEGAADKTDQLMARIATDARHKNVVILDQWSFQARLFGGWNMVQPDLAPLSDQSFRIINEVGTGAQVVGVLLGLLDRPDRFYWLS